MFKRCLVIIGADVSGNTTGGGQARHIAIVVCTDESVNKVHQKIGPTKIHMSRLPDSKRQKVFQELKFNNYDLIGLCLNVERQNTADHIIDNISSHPTNDQKIRIRKHFDYLLWKEIRDKVESSAFPRRCEIEDIVMQCDSDIVNTGKNWKMKTAEKGQAHDIADAVAWYNECGKSISSCIDIDLVAKLRDGMKHDLLK